MSGSWFLIYQQKEPGLLREMVDSRAVVGYIHTEHIEVPASKEILPNFPQQKIQAHNHKSMSEGHMS